MILALLGVAAVAIIALLTAHISHTRTAHVRLLQFIVWVTFAEATTIDLLRMYDVAPTVQRYLNGGGAALIAVVAISTMLAPQRQIRRPNGGLAAIAAAITLVEGVYLFQNGHIDATSLPEALLVFALPGIVFLVRLTDATRQELLRLARMVVTAEVWGSLVCAIVAPSVAFLQTYGNERRLQIFGLHWRLNGLTPQPNLLGVTSVLCFVLVRNSDAKLRRTTLIASVIVLVLTESRDSAIALAAVLFATWTFSEKRGVAVRASFAVPVMAGLVFFGSSYVEHLGQGALTADIQSNGRFRIWNLVMNGFFADPLHGYGPLAFRPELNSPLLLAGLDHAHNQILEGIAEAGLVGGILSAALVLWVMKVGWQFRHQGAILGVAIAYLASVFSEPYLTFTLYGVNFAIIPGFTIIIVLMAARAPERRPEIPPESGVDAKMQGTVPHARDSALLKRHRVPSVMTRGVA